MLPLFQFPWRMLGPLSFVAALVAGLLYHYSGLRGLYAAIIAALLIVVNAAPLLQRFEPLSADQRGLAAASLNPAVIAQRRLPATVLDEYLPRGADKEAGLRMPPGTVLVPVGQKPDNLEVVSAESARIELSFSLQRESNLSLARWYFPVWRADLDGQASSTESGPFGTLTVRVPAGEHRLTVQPRQPKLRIWGIAISLVSLVASALILSARMRALTNGIGITGSTKGPNDE
jgi:hypothetical protein